MSVPDPTGNARTLAAIGRLRNAARAAAAAPRHTVVVANRDLHELLFAVDALARRCADHAAWGAQLEGQLVAARVDADRAGDNFDTLVRAVNDAGVTGPVLQALHGKPATQGAIQQRLPRQPAEWDDNDPGRPF